MRFRKRPIVVEAVQFDGKHPRDTGVYLYQSPLTHSNSTDTSSRGCFWVIDTLEGKMEVSPGDWIITGIKGEKYPCKPDIFEMTYEPAKKGENE